MQKNQKSKILLAPSILSADRSKLEKEVKVIEPFSDWLHIDIMDGKFVPPKTFTFQEIKKINTHLIKDVHLMVEHPLSEGYINDFILAGADIITIHVECKEDIVQCLRYIRSKGLKCGLSINPPTDVKRIIPFIKEVDMVLVMSVNPGYGGQSFIQETLEKIKFLRKRFPELRIQIDGGINKDTVNQATSSGTDIIVAGSAIFGQKDRKKAIEEIKSNF